MANSEVEAIRAMLAQSAPPASLAEFRHSYDELGNLFPVPDDVSLRNEIIAGNAAEWSETPHADKSRVILYLHGGGYVIGSLDSHRPLVTELGRTAGVLTLALDYRLAPEAPFPAAVDDAIAAYQFLLDQGFSASSIAIAGDSAGGGLTIATLLKARELELPQPACALCVSPWVDLELVGKTLDSKKTEDPLLQRELLQQWSALYLNGEKANNPFATPLNADLTGIAPLLIQVGSAEVLLDDAIRLTACAALQNVAVRLDTWPDMIHVWHHYYPILSDAHRALVRAGDYIKEQMGKEKKKE